MKQGICDVSTLPVVITEYNEEISDTQFDSGTYSASNRNEYRKISGGKARSACKAENFTTICQPTV
jgi:hypothetical protein